MYVVAAGQVQDPYASLLGELGVSRVIQVVCIVLGATAQDFVDNNMRLVIFARGHRDVSLDAENFCLRASGKRLREVVGEVVPVPEDAKIEVGVEAPVRAQAGPIPVSGLGDTRRDHDEEN